MLRTSQPMGRTVQHAKVLLIFAWAICVFSVRWCVVSIRYARSRLAKMQAVLSGEMSGDSPNPAVRTSLHGRRIPEFAFSSQRHCWNAFVQLSTRPCRPNRIKQGSMSWSWQLHVDFLHLRCTGRAPHRSCLRYSLKIQMVTGEAIRLDVCESL